MRNADATSDQFSSGDATLRFITGLWHVFVRFLLILCENSNMFGAWMDLLTHNPCMESFYRSH